MRKWIALVLAVLQLGFGGFLIANGRREDQNYEADLEEEMRAAEARHEEEKRARAARADEIIANGTEFVFYLDSFEYDAYSYTVEPLYVSLTGSYSPVLEHRYFPLAVDENGMAAFGPGVDALPEEPYYALNGDSYCRIDEEVLRALFGADLGKNDEFHSYYRFPFASDKILFEVSGEWVSVYAVGYVYQGDVAFTGLIVDGVRY